MAGLPATRAGDGTRNLSKRLVGATSSARSEKRHGRIPAHTTNFSGASGAGPLPPSAQAFPAYWCMRQGMLRTSSARSAPSDWSALGSRMGYPCALRSASWLGRVSSPSSYPLRASSRCRSRRPSACLYALEWACMTAYSPVCHLGRMKVDALCKVRADPVTVAQKQGDTGARGWNVGAAYEALRDCSDLHARES